MTTKRKLKAKIIYEGKQKKRFPITSILIAAIIIAAVLVGYLSNWGFYLHGEETTNAVLVTINGEAINQNELNAQWDSLPVIAKMQMTKDQLLKELVQETVLLQKAKENNIIVSDEEVEQFINLQLNQMNMTYEQFEEALATQGTNAQDMKEIYKKQLTVAKLFDSTIDSALNATEEEINSYYEKNKESFYREEQVQVRHILVEINDAMNESTAQERVDLILGELDENNGNFCELVQKYSSDFGSVSNCGEYTFGKGQMVEEFEKAGYDMKNGEVRVVKTSYGFHIILKISNIPEGYIKLNESISGIEGSPTLAEGIEQVIVKEKAQEVFNEYVSELEKTADIVYFDILENTTIEKPETTKIEVNSETGESEAINNESTNETSSNETNKDKNELNSEKKVETGNKTETEALETSSNKTNQTIA